MPIPKCAARGCNREAAVEVRHYDVYLHDHSVEIFDEQDQACPFLCFQHARENEEGAVGRREPHGSMVYLHTNQQDAPGFTIYRTLTPQYSKDAKRREASR